MREVTIFLLIDNMLKGPYGDAARVVGIVVVCVAVVALLRR